MATMRAMRFVKIMDHLDPMLVKMEVLLDRYSEYANDGNDAKYENDYNEIMEALEKLKELVQLHSQDFSIHREER